jgi:hypothetical protein
MSISPMSIGISAAAFFAGCGVGFVAGSTSYGARLSSEAAPKVASETAPTPASLGNPTDADASGALRRMVVSGVEPPFPQATVTVGHCERSAEAAGVICATKWTDGKGSPARDRTIGFSKVGGQWVVSRW